MTPTDVIELSSRLVSTIEGNPWNLHIIISLIAFLVTLCISISILTEFGLDLDLVDIIVTIISVVMLFSLIFGVVKSDDYKIVEYTIQISPNASFEDVNKYEIRDNGIRTADGSIIYTAYKKDGNGEYEHYYKREESSE